MTRRLAVNFDGDGVFPTPGSWRVQVTDSERTVTKGFSYADCEAFKGDSVRAKIRWKDADIASLAAGRSGSNLNSVKATCLAWSPSKRSGGESPF
jgi:hypothetical protein